MYDQCFGTHAGNFHTHSINLYQSGNFQTHTVYFQAQAGNFEQSENFCVIVKKKIAQLYVQSEFPDICWIFPDTRRKCLAIRKFWCHLIDE